MLDRAILDIERTSATLLTALDEGRWDEAKKLAHALKGVTQQMGAFKLKNLAISIMQMDIAGLKGSRRKLAAELADLSANSVAALREVRTAPRPNAAGEWVA
jgi:HPt (histidine-containing phosphotransfer) domain-containing protein